MSPRTILGYGPVIIVAAIISTVFLLEVEVARLFGAVFFCLFVPGFGWARRMRLKDGGDTLAMALVVSLCATILVATAMVVSGWWSPVAGFIILLLIATAGFVRLRRGKTDGGFRGISVSFWTPETPETPVSGSGHHRATS